MAKNRDNSDFYLGNKNLPKAGLEFDYTPEMIKEMDKARKSILFFAENFFYIVNLDRGREKIKLHKCQKRVLKSLKDNRFVTLLASRQIGKALALDTRIPTPTGYTTMGDLKDGDQVYGLDGTPCNVVKAHDVMYNRPCYKIEFDNGETIVADEEHLWFTQSRSERMCKSEGSVKTTKDLVETLHSGREPNHRIPSAINGVSGEAKELPIDPYVLGLWLGDGACSSSVITSGKRDIYDLVEILDNHPQFDKKILHEYKDGVFSLRLTVEEGVKSKSLSALLRTCNLLDNKHIPVDYMLANREHRLELLKGLIDSDGYINKNGTAQFYNSNIELARQVKQLIESLGYKATFKTRVPRLNGAECLETASITFKPIEYVCKLAFKRNRIQCRDKKVESNLRSQWHYIKNITPVESVPVRCITVDSKDSLFLCGEQYIATHNTTLMTIYALWIACFQKDQRILIVANKEQTAINILKRVRLAYEMLPNHLKSAAVEWGKTGVSLENGSSIGISTTSSSAGRGDSCNVLILDELAFIENHLITEFWRSVYPIISSSKQSKIFIASTPNGTDNLFYDLYSNAVQGINNWKAERVDWWEIPGRDDQWKDDQIKTLGSYEAFSQEFGNEFLNSGESALGVELFEKLKTESMDPEFVFEDGHYLVWEEPHDEGIYVAGVDIAEGVGEDASVIHILDMSDLREIKQVATYHNDLINPIAFTQKLHDILLQWGSPPALIERNNCGAQVVDQLAHTYHYKNIVTYGINGKKAQFKRQGMQAHTNTKYAGVTNMRYWISEVMACKIRDINTLKELRTFVRYPNGTWAAEAGVDRHDDRVMSLVWALMALHDDIIERYFEVIERDTNKKPMAIRAMDYGLKNFINPSSIYTNMRNSGIDADPVAFYSGQSWAGDDIAELEAQGWQMHGSF